MRASVLFLLMAAVVGPARAASDDSHARIDSMAALSGTCSRLLAGGRDVTQGCEPHFANIVFENGRLQFGFATDGEVTTAVTFSGDGDAQVKLTPDKVSQPIDRILVTTAPPGASGPQDTTTRSSPAHGACVYTSPYKGVAQVICTADTAEGRFAATFTSDGKPPAVKHF